MDSLASKEVVDHILSHHGVKGMHWGVRKGGDSGGSSSGKASKSEVTIKTRSGTQHKTIIRTSGGRGLPAHPDAVAAKVITQKLKKSGMHTLSNTELQSLATRVNLEGQVNRAGVGKSGIEKGIKTTTAFMKSPQGKTALEEATKLATSDRGRKIAKHLFKGAAVAAAMA